MLAQFGATLQRSAAALCGTGEPGVYPGQSCECDSNGQAPAPRKPLQSFKQSHRRKAATAIEYCFILSLVLMVILLAVQHFGESVGDSFTESETKLTEVLSTN